MNRVFKAIAQALLGKYEVYRIFSTDCLPSQRPPSDLRPQFVSVGVDAIRDCPDQEIRSQAWYAGEGSRAFAFVLHDQIVGLCFYWHGVRYRQRNYWPLGPDEAKLVQVFCVPSLRGIGLGRSLIEHSTASMLQSGYRRLFARVWYTHAQSVRAFRSAGWLQVACVLGIDPLRSGRSIRLTFRSPAARLRRARSTSDSRGSADRK